MGWMSTSLEAHIGKAHASRLRPATARLLERIFGDNVEHLLSTPTLIPLNRVFPPILENLGIASHCHASPG
jgi:hypothetical protein